MWLSCWLRFFSASHAVSEESGIRLCQVTSQSIAIHHQPQAASECSISFWLVGQFFHDHDVPFGENQNLPIKVLFFCFCASQNTIKGVKANKTMTGSIKPVIFQDPTKGVKVNAAVVAKPFRDEIKAKVEGMKKMGLGR